MSRSNEDRYLTGNYAPVTDETVIAGLPVEGTIPLALDGRFLQIGPNLIGRPARPFVWEEADGMVHAVTLQPGRAPTYRNRWVVTASASKLLGTEPAHGDSPTVPAVVNANVVAVGDRILAMAEHAGYELGPELETRRRVLLGRGLEQRTCESALVPRRFTYSRRSGEMPFDGTEILKHDLVTGSVQRRDFGPGRHPGTFVFVTDPERTDAEDGGWLIAFVHDDRTALAQLVIVDAGDLGSSAVATVHITRRVPYGLHGSWAPSRPAIKEKP